MIHRPNVIIQIIHPHTDVFNSCRWGKRLKDIRNLDNENISIFIVWFVTLSLLSPETPYQISNEIISEIYKQCSESIKEKKKKEKNKNEKKKVAE